MIKTWASEGLARMDKLGGNLTTIVNAAYGRGSFKGKSETERLDAIQSAVHSALGWSGTVRQRLRAIETSGGSE